MLGTYQLYRSTIANLGKQRDALLKHPQFGRETAYYTQHIKNVHSVDDFLADDKLYSYALKAYGLGDMNYAKGFIRKVLTDHEFTSRLVDKRYVKFAAAFDFVEQPKKATESDSATKGTVNKFLQQTLEEELDDTNPGVRLALYFSRTIGELQKNDALSPDSWAYQLLSDKAVSKVVFAALGISDAVRGSNVEAQKRLIEQRLSFADIATPEGIDRLVARFAASYDQEKMKENNATLALFPQDTRIGGFSAQSLQSLQGMRRY